MTDSFTPSLVIADCVRFLVLNSSRLELSIDIKIVEIDQEKSMVHHRVPYPLNLVIPNEMARFF